MLFVLKYDSFVRVKADKTVIVMFATAFGTVFVEPSVDLKAKPVD